MRTSLKFALALTVLLFVVIFACKKKSSTTCTPACQNGGRCVNNACNCPDGWQGSTCETYYTAAYAGDYMTTDFSCDHGQHRLAFTIQVKVDPDNKDRLLFSSMYANMTDHTHFTIPKQGSQNYTGSGTIDGKTMTYQYTTSTSTAICSGTFTKQ